MSLLQNSLYLEKENSSKEMAEEQRNKNKSEDKNKK